MSLACINLHDLKLDCRLVFSGSQRRVGDGKIRLGVPLNMVRIATSILVALVTTACGSSPMEPIASSMLIGDFGAEHVVLHSTSKGAEIDYICMAVTVPQPLTTDANGHFTATGFRHRTGGAAPIEGEGSTPVRIDGRAYRAQGGTIQMVVSDIPEEPGAPIPWSDALTLVRDRPATLFLCP
jgi:hypothetical protein